MKVLLINSVCGIRSTGRICTDLAQQFENEGHEVKIAYGRVDEVPEQFQKYAVRVGNDMDLKLHALMPGVHIPSIHRYLWFHSHDLPVFQK